MARAQRLAAAGGAGLFLLLAAGCGGYYQVTDPNAGRLYFARSLSVDGRSGDLIMRDDLRDSEMRLHEYEVKDLTREEYRQATRNLKQ